MTQDSTKDFFISYDKADQAWAEWMAWQLEAEGYTTILQAWDFLPGSNIVLKMHEAAQAARRTIAVLSPAYLDALSTQPEWAAAFVQDPTGAQGTLLPIRVQECTLPGLLAATLYIDLVGLEEGAAHHTMLAGIRLIRAKPSIAPGFPGGVSPTVPRSPDFPAMQPPVWKTLFQRTPTSTSKDQNRQRMLARVQAIWINGFLEQSLHGAALIALGLHEHPDALATPWRLAVQELNQPARPLPPGTHITQVYDNVGGELLILGEPGSGKTTLLLELARDFLDRAWLDDSQPMPVVFNLSSWAEKRQSLTDWLVDELNTKYQVPRKLGQSWVDDDKLLLLLDGLDEVIPTYFADCVKAINTYRQEHGLVPTVVCSRSDPYLNQVERLLLDNAVIVQPLTREQIDKYLASAGEQLETVRVALRDDWMLRELAATPLMLSVLTLAYHGKSVEDLLAAPPMTRRQQVFETYVQRMLQRRGAKTPYTAQNTKKWLTWLAKQMEQHNQAEFYIERMQPAWLAESRPRRLYQRVTPVLALGLLSGVVSILVLGLLDGLILGLINGLNNGVLSGLGKGLVTGLEGAWPLGLVTGLVFALFGWVETEIKPAVIIVWSWTSIWRRLVKIESLRKGLLFGLAFALLSGLVFALITGLAFGLLYGLLNGLVDALLYGLLGGLVFGLLSRQVVELPAQMPDKHTFVIPNQGIRHSAWSSLLIGLIYGLAGGLAYGLLGGLAFGLLGWLVGRRSTWSSMLLGLVFGLAGWLASGLLIGLAFGPLGELVFGLLGGLVFGLLGWLVGRRSVRSKVLVGLVFGLVGGLIFGLFIGLFVWLASELFFGRTTQLNELVFDLLNGLIFGLLSGLVFGLTSRLATKIKPAKVIVWLCVSIWRRLVKIGSLRIGLLGGLYFGLNYGLNYGVLTGLVAGLYNGLVFSLVAGASSGLLSGLSWEMLDEHTFVKPNQGIRHSARNSTLVGLIFGLAGGLLGGLIFGLLNGLVNGLASGLEVGLYNGLFIGLLSGLGIGLLNGGTDCIQHIVLRFSLWRAGYMPLNYPHFLDYAAERILLRKVGGGYIFVHRLLLDYFARLESTGGKQGFHEYHLQTQRNYNEAPGGFVGSELAYQPNPSSVNDWSGPGLFTPCAREVLSLAQEEAQRLQHNYIGTEHLLLGLVLRDECVAAKALSSLGVELHKVRSSVEFIIGRGDRIVLGEIGLTPRAKKVIELAVDEARHLNHYYVGTAHLLLALVREGEGIAAGVLESLGVNLEKVRTQTIMVGSMEGWKD